MPFNEKGEFIRAGSSPRQPSKPATRPSQLRIPAPDRPRITSSEDRPGQQPTPAPPHQSRTSIRGWRVLGLSLLTLLGIAAAIGLIWVLVVFHRWILIGLALWLIASIRNLFY